MTTTVASLLARAASQLGTYERTGRNDVLYADYYGITGYAWCYVFVQWCFETDNARLPFTTMYVPAGVGWSRQNLQSVERGSPPQPGDIAHFTWSMAERPPTRPGTGDHVGLVESWNGLDTLTTIEGNVGAPQGVWRMKRSINATIVNFWRPVGVYSDDGATPSPEEDFLTVEQYNEVTAMLSYAQGLLQRLVNTTDVTHGVVTAARTEAGIHAGNVVNTVNPHVTEEAHAVMANSNQLAAGIKPGESAELPVAEALKKASIAQLFDEIASRTKGKEGAA